MERTFSVTIRLASDRDELDLTQDIESALWDGLTGLVNVGHVDDVSHVDVEETGDES